MVLALIFTNSSGVTLPPEPWVVIAHFSWGRKSPWGCGGPTRAHLAPGHAGEWRLSEGRAYSDVACALPRSFYGPPWLPRARTAPRFAGILTAPAASQP